MLTGIARTWVLPSNTMNYTSFTVSIASYKVLTRTTKKNYIPVMFSLEAETSE